LNLEVNMLETGLAALAAYLIGSLSFAVIVSRVMGLADPRGYGSGNPGATNVLRSGSKAAALVTLLLDAFKGWLPVMLVQWFGARYGLDDGAPALVGLAAFVGHLWPVFFRFAGGKGVATAAGVLLALQPWLGAAALVTWLVVVLLFRFSSLASIATGALVPAWDWIGANAGWWPASGVRTLALTAMGLLLIWCHRENIRRLLAGTESKLGRKKAP
jgi:glycerol-3-phosphate acyltransferase PlsY